LCVLYMQVKAETEAEQKINNSYQSLYKQMVDIMRGLGIEAVPTTGTPFDPEVHEAIMREPNNEVEDGTVLQEFRKGFRLGSKLLRPAMVKVGTHHLWGVGCLHKCVAVLGPKQLQLRGCTCIPVQCSGAALLQLQQHLPTSRSHACGGTQLFPCASCTTGVCQ
jgi:hypothetical protein